ncbi:hypothetical protein [Nocardia rhamnosiphila]|uniref:hypothetical protein n=1 Tax=Nocardia rhamnosiphila TaxID=426716 RepID=UPI000A67585D|nr:hypothetical protein [Nocardia rhamnosiphila]
MPRWTIALCWSGTVTPNSTTPRSGQDVREVDADRADREDGLAGAGDEIGHFLDH